MTYSDEKNEPRSTAASCHHVRQFWRAARENRTWRFRPPAPAGITFTTLVFIDEASIVGTRDMHTLAEIVEHGQGTLLTVEQTTRATESQEQAGA